MTDFKDLNDTLLQFADCLMNIPHTKLKSSTTLTSSNPIGCLYATFECNQFFIISPETKS